uniref:Kazal-like domain-containing protein n=1 Tax=Homalodisca liturata TaxID=320908 RepID=A0A1B6I9G3_9HEMI
MIVLKHLSCNIHKYQIEHEVFNHSTKKVVKVFIFGLTSCFAQDIMFPEDNNEGELPIGERIGMDVPSWWNNWMPNSIYPNLSQLDRAPDSGPTRPLRPPPKSSQDIITVVPCQCPFTPQYSPVCGSDGQSYGNMAILNCYRTCGFDVTFVRASACAQVAGIRENPQIN